MKNHELIQSFIGYTIVSVSKGYTKEGFMLVLEKDNKQQAIYIDAYKDAPGVIFIDFGG